MVKQKTKGLLEDLIAAATKSTSGTPMALVFNLLAVMGFAFIGWKLLRAKRKAAMLEHKLRRNEELARQLVENESLDANSEDKALAEVAIAKLTKDADSLKSNIEFAKKTYDDTSAKIQKISSWDDIEIVRS